jgi:hypothetical protein
MPVLLGLTLFEFSMFQYSEILKGSHFELFGEIQSMTALKELPVKGLEHCFQAWQRCWTLYVKGVVWYI